jgi:FixJ family two-component response regulator
MLDHIVDTPGYGDRALSSPTRLIAEGATNRAAASHLFLSPHTINSHLRHAFTKLGITTRVELTRIVLANERPGTD